MSRYDLAMQRSRTILIVASLAICGCTKPEVKKIDWTTRSVATVSDAVAGFRFKLALPHGMTRKLISPTRLRWESSQAPSTDLWISVHVIESAITEPAMDSVCQTPVLGDPPCSTTRQETLPNGFAITGQRADRIDAAVFRVRGNKTLACHAIRSAGSSNVLGRIDAERAYAEKVCDSLTTQ